MLKKSLLILTAVAGLTIANYAAEPTPTPDAGYSQDVNVIEQDLQTKITKCVSRPSTFGTGKEVAVWGSVQNIGKHYGIRWIHVKIYGFDKNGNLVSNTMAYGTAERWLRPGQTGYFHETLDGPDHEIKKVKTSVEFDLDDVMIVDKVFDYDPTAIPAS